MKKIKPVLALTLALALCPGLLAGCGAGGPGVTPTPTPAAPSDAPEPAVYRKLYGMEVSTVNYLVSNTQLEQQVGANVVDCLVEYDQYGNLQPSLATSWIASDDGLVYTFKLREGVKWMNHKGEEVADLTAADFVSAASYVLNAANKSGTAASYFGVVKNAEAYYNYTAYLLVSENGAKTADADGNPIEAVEPVAFETVGITAVDSHTLKYTLERPAPYFLSGLTYVCFMPAYGPFLAEKGKEFGAATDASTLLYCGAFLLSELSPQQSHVYIKNPAYWDKGHVYLDRIEETYHAQHLTAGPQMAKNGEIDQADVSTDILDAWLLDPGTANIVSRYRARVDYSFFYCFNFDPKFDAQYEPENWRLAVNNENFRQSLMAGLDRMRELSILDPNDPGSLLINTITPPNFASYDGKPYVRYGDLAGITANDSFNEMLALQARDAARDELEAAGATFPVKILVRYNPATADWDKECARMEQQMESLLGADYIDIIVLAGPESNFLTEVRRSGQYAFMKCGWAADYADPQTWTDPFYGEYRYAFLEAALAEGGAAAGTISEYRRLVELGIAETSDIARRYELFAAAEAYLINHALAVPFSTSQYTYQVSRLNVFEAQYAPFGVSSLRYKGQRLYDEPISMEQWAENLAAWEAGR